MFSPSCFCVVEAEQSKSAPSPRSKPSSEPKGRSAVKSTPRYHPVSASSKKAALKRRNGARRPGLVGVSSPFAWAARERTSAHLHPEALSAGEASLFAVVYARTLSVAAFRVYSDLLVLITMCYLSTFSAALQARAAIFREIGVFACLLARFMISLTQRFTESEVHPYGLGCRFLLPERKSLSILSSKCTLLSKVKPLRLRFGAASSPSRGAKQRSLSAKRGA